MTPQHHLPADIERTSLSIITAELDAMGLTPPPETAAARCCDAPGCKSPSRMQKSSTRARIAVSISV